MELSSDDICLENCSSPGSWKYHCLETGRSCFIEYLKISRYLPRSWFTEWCFERCYWSWLRSRSSVGPAYGCGCTGLYGIWSGWSSINDVCSPIQFKACIFGTGWEISICSFWGCWKSRRSCAGGCKCYFSKQWTSLCGVVQIISGTLYTFGLC